MVSPKKASFEAGGDNHQEAITENVDFSSGKVTPTQAQAATQGNMKSSYEIRSAK